MVRPLLEINHPWLTRDDAESAIWRLTGLKNAGIVEQLLRIMDIYAVSQGSALAQQIRDRDATRRRWGYGDQVIPMEDSRTRLRVVDPLEDPDGEVSEAPSEAAAKPEKAKAAKPAAVTISPELPFLPPDEPLDAPGRPLKAAEAWLMPDGSFTQRCTICSDVKDYKEFHSSAVRWNGIASQCKPCKNNQRRNSYSQHQAAPGSLAHRRWLDEQRKAEHHTDQLCSGL